MATTNSNNFSLASLVSLDLDGGEGNDLLIGGDGVDVLRGGAGNDTLLGNRGNDIVLGQDGNDLLIVNNGDGSDFLEGGLGNDFVQVNGANGAGDDFSIDPNGERVEGQDGSDLLIFNNGDGSDFLEGGSGTDTVQVNGADGAGDDFSISPNGQRFRDFESDDLAATGKEGEERAGGGIESNGGGVISGLVVEGEGNDVLIGDEGRDIIAANDGNDFLEGGADIDTVQVNGNNSAGDSFLAFDPGFSGGIFVAGSRSTGEHLNVDELLSIEEGNLFAEAQDSEPMSDLMSMASSPPIDTSAIVVVTDVVV